MVGVGEMRHRVKVTRFAKTQDSVGAVILTPVKQFIVFAAVEQSAKMNEQQGGGLDYPVTLKFVTQRCDIQGGDIVQFGFNSYRVVNQPVSDFKNRLQFYGEQTTRS